VSDVAAGTGTASSRTIAAGQLARAAWRAAGGPLRWLIAAAGIAGGVVRQGLRPISWRRPARAELVRFMELAGVQNLPAVAIAGILVGISMVAQGMYWLDQVGEDDPVFTVIAVVLIREIAPLVVGLLAIGRGGLLILDELSELRRDGQYRALDLQGIDPFLVLIMPRVLALAIGVFCLTMIFLVVAFASGYVIGSLLDVTQRSWFEFGVEAFATIGTAGYAVLPLKTLGIGLAIGVVCCLTALEQRAEAGAGRALMPVGFMRSVLAVFLVSGLVSGLASVL
jgi:phospholipid/cholesterol/gamma-HCH transport system permease protein